MYSPFRHINSIFWKKRPIHLTFFLTRRCNAKCPFCFYLKTDTNSVIQNTELSLDEIEKISGSMDLLLWLAFSGGEIYLREDLVEISRIFYRNNKPAVMLFMLLYPFFTNRIFLVLPLITVCFNLYINKNLLRAFYRAKGAFFAIQASLYYTLIYPLAVGAGSFTGMIQYYRNSARR